MGDGFVVTDYTASAEMTDHGMGDLETVSALSLHAGGHIDRVSDGFVGTISAALERGTVTMDAVYRAVHRILEATYKLGLFGDPYRYGDPEREKTQIYTAEHRAGARRIAGESFVLLRNEGPGSAAGFRSGLRPSCSNSIITPSNTCANPVFSK